MAKITRNGKTYDSVDVKCTINGAPIEVTSLTYGNEQENQLNWTLGSSEATSWSTGKRTPSATMGIMMHDVTPLELAASGSILDIKPFNVQVTFTNENNVQVIDTLLVKFQKEGREVTGEMGLKMEYPLFALSVKLNTK
ncbi:hypothetical protein SAMN05443634_104109 [Chishuiella changwenlii]|uniref:Phage tail tube protein n=1 Tax=Chishuiella changwenlii TaxID=1434701 RepID=A0A1M6W050_9FLAO|nr:hypothetical protein [Chishuiella changwenlii]GGE89422.1 hypothetical protein GCM10010984_03820 [Chishuiella changwenlii]SHK87142.1 hypothetical protein SAMN05443634_104109 [Chishuiella changwenlii]